MTVRKGASGIVVASQLSERFNEKIRAAAPFAEIHNLPPGAVSPLPAAAEVILAAPFKGQAKNLERPISWPGTIKWIQLVSAGADFYPPWFFEGPVVTTTSGTSSVSVSEFAIAAMFAHAKRIPDIWINRAADWKTSRLDNIQDSVLAVYGYGAIGAAIARRANALGMKVVVMRRSRKRTPAYVTLANSAPELVQHADHLVLAAPLTNETCHFVNRDLLAAAKPGIHIVNVGRGGLIDDAALLEALDDGRVSAASLDVTEPEPLPDGHPFYDHPRIKLSPHTAPFTPDQSRNILDVIVRNLRRFRKGEKLHAVFNRQLGY